MLINGWTSPAGDSFPALLRKARLGPLIQTRTRGAIVAASSLLALLVPAGACREAGELATLETQRQVPASVAAGDIAIEDVTIIDATAGSAAEARIPNRTVILRGDRIARVGSSERVSVPEGAQRIDGRGKFLLPSFWDMHVHFNRDTPTQLNVMGPLMIAHGVTSARDMLADCWEPCGAGRKTLAEMRELQRLIEDGEAIAPRLQALSSPAVQGQRGGFGYPADYPEYWRPRTEEHGRELARFLNARGVDFIKVLHTVIPEAYFGLLDEAGRIDLDVSGHVPWSVHPIDAARAGVRTIEHARWPGMACNPGYEAFREMYERFARGDSDFDVDVFAKYRDAVVPEFDEKLCAEIFRALIENDVYLVPTHLTREMDAMASDSSYRDDPRRAYVPPARLRGWDRDLTNTANGPPELLEFYRQFFPLGLRVTGLAQAAGVKIMVGTDAFDTMVFPGFSYHDELVHLSEAGLTQLEILRAATYRGAEFLGLTDDFGTVAEGKLADLVLLDADPLADIRNSTRINSVFYRGKAYDRDALDQMIHDVEAYVAGLR